MSINLVDEYGHFVAKMALLDNYFVLKFLYERFSVKISISSNLTVNFLALLPLPYRQDLDL